jgi:hypothetical protein
MAPTDTVIRKVKPTAKPYKMADLQGFYLPVNPNRSKLWRVKYRIDGVERELSLGSCPMVNLAEAGVVRDAARRQVSQMIDPNAARRQAPIAAAAHRHHPVRARKRGLSKCEAKTARRARDYPDLAHARGSFQV